MRLAIFGASGATGRLVVQQALAAGYEVAVLLRRHDGVLIDNPRLQRFVGVLDNPATVNAVLHGADVVISVVGIRKGGPQDVCTEAVRSILKAMEHTRTRRLIALSAFGALETHNASWFIRLVRAIISKKMRDKDQMENLVRASTVDWTLIRPSALTNGKAGGNYRSSIALRPGISGRLSRDDLASFIIDECKSGKYIHQAPVVSI